ncbi:MAG: hypothetical protein JWP43_2350, partial [Ramlibacter sp.]|nr:hypothetical protein [Ramlibacter sp.]
SLNLLALAAEYADPNLRVLKDAANTAQMRANKSAQSTRNRLMSPPLMLEADLAWRRLIDYTQRR